MISDPLDPTMLGAGNNQPLKEELLLIIVVTSLIVLASLANAS